MERNLLVVLSFRGEDLSETSQQIQKVLKKHKIKHQIFVAKSLKDIKRKLTTEDLKKFSTVAIHGGDGSLMAAVECLLDKSVELIILPGGTANTMAKYIRMPEKLLEALQVYVNHKYRVEKIDIAKINKNTLVMDTHFGWWSEAVIGASQQSKQFLGEYAYGLRAIASSAAPLEDYEFTVDGKNYQEKGKTLMVANYAEQGILGVPLFKAPHRPGLLQLALLKTSNPLLWTVWYAGRQLLGRNYSRVVELWRGSEIVVKKAPKPQLLDDQKVKLDRPITIKANCHHINLVTPLVMPPASKLKRSWIKLKLETLRLYEGAKVFIFGRPSDKFSHIAPKLYLGGMYRDKALRLFEEWGITGVVNMRESQSIAHPKAIETLHLATKDLHQPTLENFQKGVDFIQRHIDDGGGVYVHCRLGEGRGPSMAAAYLISTGLSAGEAVENIRRYRPFIRPTKLQMDQLSAWQNHLNG